MSFKIYMKNPDGSTTEINQVEKTQENIPVIYKAPLPLTVTFDDEMSSTSNTRQALDDWIKALQTDVKPEQKGIRLKDLDVSYQEDIEKAFREKGYDPDTILLYPESFTFGLMDDPPEYNIKFDVKFGEPDED